MIIHSFFKYNYLLLNPEEMLRETIKAVKKLNEAIELFARLSSENNFRFLVVFHPLKNEIIDGHYQYINSMVTGLKNSPGKIDVLDMLEYFSEKEKINKNNFQQYFWKIDGHHNSFGYSVFAKGIEKKLEEMKITE